jgi:hypothetical protein
MRRTSRRLRWFLVGAVLLVAIAGCENWRRTLPCESYRGTLVRNIPVRCLSYYTGEGR